MLSAFLYKQSNRRQKVPNDVVRAKIDSTVEKIREEAFQGREQLKHVEFSEGLQEIGEDAFAECSSLQSISPLPSTTRILGEWAFESCTRLRNVTLNVGLREIRSCAFADSGIESIDIPSTVEIIGERAFYYCDLLKQVTFNEGLEEIQDGAFRSSAIESIDIPSTVKIIGNWAFHECVHLKAASLNEGLVEIGDGAFQGCRELKEQVYVPSTVKRLSDTAFDKNVRLLRADEKKTEKDSAQEATCHNEEPVLIPPEEEATVIPDEGTQRHSGQIKNAPSQQILMDEHIIVQYNEEKQEVPKDACRARIESTVKKITAEAFRNCKSLKEVEFCEGLEEVGKSAFKNCVSLALISLPSTTRIICSDAFYSCESLKLVRLREGLVEIRAQAFSWCKSLEEVSFPSTMRSLGRLVFANCQQLRWVLLNDGLVEIGDFAFCNCDMLENVRVPPSVERIGREALPLAAARKRTRTAASTANGQSDDANRTDHRGTDEESPGDNNAAEETVLRTTSEDSNRSQDVQQRASDLEKKLEAFLSERDDEISSLRRELRNTISDRDKEIQTLRAGLKQSNDRERFIKDAVSERDEKIKYLEEQLKKIENTAINRDVECDEEIKFLREQLKNQDAERDKEIQSLREQLKSQAVDYRELRANFATLQESLDSLKHRLDVSSAPAADAVTTNEDQANKRPRLESTYGASSHDGIPLAIRQKLQSLKDQMNDMIDSVITEGDRSHRSTTL